MYTPRMLLEWLGDAILDYQAGDGAPFCDGGIKLLEPGGDPLRPECLYVAEAAGVVEALAQGRIPGAPLLLVVSGAAPAGLTPPNQLHLIWTRLPLAALYNQVQEYIHRFWAWDGRLQQVVYTNGGLQEMLERAYEQLHATILLLNAGYKRIASVHCPQVRDDTADELRDNGYQSFDTIQAIRRETPLRQGSTACGRYVEYLSRQSGNYTVVHLIQYREDVAARLCIILDGPDPRPCYADLSAILAGYVAEYMFSNQGVDYGSNAAFGSLAADLIELRLTDPVELEQRLKQIQLAVRRYYHVMLVAFDDQEARDSIPWNYLISQLERFFPFSNITTYHGEILLIIRKMNRGARLLFNEEGLRKLLLSYNGYAAIGNFSEFLTSLPPIYHQARNALRLGRVMDPEKRIYYYEDYSMFQIAEMAAEAARQNMGSRNPVHLCHPALISLLLYDKKTGSNLTDDLYAFLIHERSVTETARALYIHRNTMLYKARRIEEIMGQSLADPLLRERLLFSYHVLDYMKRYRKEDILILKRNRVEDYAGAAAPPQEGGKG